MKAISAATLLIAGTLALSGCDNTTVNSTRDSITVSGNGAISAQPDRFMVIATASQNGDDMAEMKDQVDDAVSNMLDLADDLDIEEKSVTASTMRITPQWQYQPERKLVGHQISREVSFQVDGLETYAELLEGLAEQGVRNIRPAGAQVSNRDKLAKKALEKAVEDARERAEILAEAADRDLGEAFQIQAQGINSPQPVMMMARAKDSGAAESYRPGETEISAQVQITFELD